MFIVMVEFSTDEKCFETSTSKRSIGLVCFS